MPGKDVTQLAGKIPLLVMDLDGVITDVTGGDIPLLAVDRKEGNIAP
jgi:hypothetical protein